MERYDGIEGGMMRDKGGMGAEHDLKADARKIGKDNLRGQPMREVVRA